MTEKATQCPICLKGKREQDKYCSEQCSLVGEALDILSNVDHCDRCERDPNHD
jgi:predicted nucleic acid-binding Zn ribbon protein